MTRSWRTRGLGSSSTSQTGTPRRRASVSTDQADRCASGEGEGVCGTRAYSAGGRADLAARLNGLRVSEATGADIEHLGLERGHRTLTITRKGGKVVTIPLAPRTDFDETLRGTGGERLEVEISGITMEIVWVPSEAPDEIAVWLPGLGVLQTDLAPARIPLLVQHVAAAAGPARRPVPPRRAGLSRVRAQRRTQLARRAACSVLRRARRRPCLRRWPRHFCPRPVGQPMPSTMMAI
jgi:hypothetical protein